VDSESDMIGSILELQILTNSVFNRTPGNGRGALLPIRTDFGGNS
jgi:hypothetical protein